MLAHFAALGESRIFPVCVSALCFLLCCCDNRPYLTCSIVPGDILVFLGCGVLQRCALAEEGGDRSGTRFVLNPVVPSFRGP